MQRPGDTYPEWCTDLSTFWIVMSKEPGSKDEKDEVARSSGRKDMRHAPEVEKKNAAQYTCRRWNCFDGMCHVRAHHWWNKISSHATEVKREKKGTLRGDYSTWHQQCRLACELRGNVCFWPLREAGDSKMCRRHWQSSVESLRHCRKSWRIQMSCRWSLFRRWLVVTR